MKKEDKRSPLLGSLPHPPGRRAGVEAGNQNRARCPPTHGQVGSGRVGIESSLRWKSLTRFWRRLRALQAPASPGLLRPSPAARVPVSPSGADLRV